MDCTDWGGDIMVFWLWGGDMRLPPCGGDMRLGLPCPIWEGGGLMLLWGGVLWMKDCCCMEAGMDC